MRVEKNILRMIEIKKAFMKRWDLTFMREFYK